MKIYNSHEHILNLTQNCTPKLRFNEGEDLGEWQKKARAKLSELLRLPEEKCEDLFEITSENDCGDYISIDFEYQSEENYFVPCTMLVPKNVKKPMTTAICLQGHSTGKHISLGISKFENDAKSIAGGRDFAVRAVKEGYCAIVMDQRYMGTAGQNENGAPACCSFNFALSALLVGKTAIGGRVWDISRLIDVCEKYLTEYVDMSKIICMGNSGGGTATFYASCIDERIHLSMPSCAVCTYEDSIMAMNHCCCNFIPDIRTYFDMGDLGGLIAPRKFVLVCGKDDPIFPLDGVKASYEIIKGFYKNFGDENKCNMVIGDGGHQFYPDDAWPVVHKLMGD